MLIWGFAHVSPVSPLTLGCAPTNPPRRGPPPRSPRRPFATPATPVVPRGHPQGVGMGRGGAHGPLGMELSPRFPGCKQPAPESHRSLAPLLARKTSLPHRALPPPRSFNPKQGSQILVSQRVWYAFKLTDLSAEDLSDLTPPPPQRNIPGFLTHQSSSLFISILQLGCDSQAKPHRAKKYDHLKTANYFQGTVQVYFHDLADTVPPPLPRIF